MRHCIHELLTSLSAHPQGHWAATEWSKGLDRWINTRGNGSFPRCPSLSQDFLFSMTSLLVFFFFGLQTVVNDKLNKNTGRSIDLSGHRFPLEDPFPQDTNASQSTPLGFQLLMSLVHLGSTSCRLRSHSYSKTGFGPVQECLSKAIDPL